MPRWLSSLAGATYAPRQSWNVKTRSEISPPPPHVPARAPPPPVSTVRQISGEVPNTVLKVSPKSPSPATCLPLLIKPAEYSCGGAAPKAAATLICCTCQVSMKLVLWSMVSVNKTEEEKSVPWLEVPFVFFFGSSYCARCWMQAGFAEQTLTFWNVQQTWTSCDPKLATWHQPLKSSRCSLAASSCTGESWDATTLHAF